MDETKLTAALPNLDVTILHRSLPEEGAEAISITLKATPSFDTAFGAFGAIGPAMLPLALWMAPMQAWTGAMQRAWAPWLGMMAALPRPERK